MTLQKQTVIIPTRLNSAHTGYPLSLEGQIVEKGLVSVIIPNWNGLKFLQNCLDSLKKSDYPQLEIILVDNGSKDASIEFLEKNFADVKLLKFAENTGFSVAVNAGIRYSSGEYIALLNNDTIVESTWISEMVKVLESHSEVGSVGCKMLAYDDPGLFDGAGDGYRRGGLPGRIGHRERDLGQFNTSRFILGPCGGAAIYRKKVFDDIGLFDEDYFAYLEDVDMALRAQSAGYKSLYVPSAVMYHLGCGTTGSGYHPLVVKLSAQNNLNTMIKNLPFFLLLKFLPQIIRWQGFYLAVVIIRGGQFFPWLKGTLSAIKMLPRMLAKRSYIAKRKVVTNDYFEKVILDSELELTESRERLIQQTKQN